MELQFTPEKTLTEIQQEFQKNYPLLNLGFFMKSHERGQPSAKKDLLETHLKISDITKGQGTISITPEMKVLDLEQELRLKFGLYVQLFRKSGSVWLETSKTDHWTIAEQIEAAKESETQYTYSAHNFADKND